MKKNVKKPKDEVINVRCTSDQKTALERVAAKEGMGVSTWVLHAALLAMQTKEAR